MVRVLAVGALVAALVVGVAGAPPAGAVGTGAIGGTVTDAVAGTPAGGVRVLVNDVANGGWAAKVTTATDGTYQVDGLAPGEYRVWFFDHGGRWYDEWHADAADAHAATRVAVADDLVTVDAALAPTPPPATTGSLTGTVTDAMSGEPLHGIRVLVNDVANGGWADKVSTAHDGTWTVADLAPGEYRVWFFDHAGHYQGEWHADAADALAATRVAVADGPVTVDAGLMRDLPPPACSPLGPWEDWMPPHDWTHEQIAAAQQLICDAITVAPMFDTVAEATALGYQWIGDGGSTGYEHYVHGGHMSTPEIFELTTVESVVFEVQPDGSRELAALMPMLPSGSTFDDIPAEWAWLPGWHVHDDLCFRGDGTVAGIAGPDGSCPPNSGLVVTPPMTHIWTAPNVCDDPFSGVDQHGVQCGGHEGH